MPAYSGLSFTRSAEWSYLGCRRVRWWNLPPSESSRDPYHFVEHTKEPLEINFQIPTVPYRPKNVFWFFIFCGHTVMKKFSKNIHKVFWVEKHDKNNYHSVWFSWRVLFGKKKYFGRFRTDAGPEPRRKKYCMKVFVSPTWYIFGNTLALVRHRRPGPEILKNYPSVKNYFFPDFVGWDRLKIFFSDFSSAKPWLRSKIRLKMADCQTKYGDTNF